MGLLRAANPEIATGPANIAAVIGMLQNTQFASDLTFVVVHRNILLLRSGDYRRCLASTYISTMAARGGGINHSI